MKLLKTWITYIIGGAALLSLSVSCHSRGEDTVGGNDLHSQVDDSIAAGSIAGALRVTLHEKQQGLACGDSDMYYRGLTHQAIVSYYASRPEDLIRQVDSLARYLDANTDNNARRLMRSRMYSIKAGYYTRFHYNPDSNIYYYKKALDFLPEGSSPELRSATYSNLAGAYRNNGMYDLGADYFSRAIQIADSADLKAKTKIIAYLGLASTYTDMRDFDQSRIWWKRAGQYWDEMTVDDKFHYLNNQGHDLYEQQRYQESLVMFQRLDSLLQANPSLEWEAYFCRANMTDLYLKLNQPDKAAELIARTEPYFTDIQPNEYIKEHIRTQKMQLSTIQGRYDQVTKMLDELKSSGAESRPEQKTERLAFLKDYYAGTGQWEKAFRAEKDYSAYEDSIRSEAQRLSMSERQMRYERDAKVLELSKDLEMHRKVQSRNLALAIVALIVILLLVMVILLMRRMSSIREERMLHRIIALRLKSLRARINPHFIYNVLNHEIAARENGQPSNLDALVRLLRRQQYMADVLSVSLADDLAFLDDFIKVESEGMTAPLEYVCDIAQDVDPAQVNVPSMVLQIFVENAFKHGFRSLPQDQVRMLMVKAFHIDGAIRIEVLNNCSPDAAPSPDSTRQGLKIVMGTLEILNEKKREVIRCDIGQWTDNPQHAGYLAAITIPTNFNFVIHGKSQDSYS